MENMEGPSIKWRDPFEGLGRNSCSDHGTEKDFDFNTVEPTKRGRNNEGNFNLKEAKINSIGLEFPNPDKIWKDLWQNVHWMKIKLFIWLVQHKKILTWENLTKRVLDGPSRCRLCDLQEEMMDHLLNLCTFTSTLWNWVTSLFRKTDKHEYNITGTLTNSRKDFSEKEIVNKS